MSGWEATYGLLVVQVTLQSLMAGGAYLVAARRHPEAAKRFLGGTMLLILPFSLRNELKIRVLPGSAAENAGFRTGDRITTLNGFNVERVENVAALWALLPYYAKLHPSLIDEGVPLKVLREGGKEVEVKLAGQVLRSFLSPSVQGADYEQALLSLARQIGIEPDSDEPTLNDVIKVRVLPGSAAERAGIRSGDQITALDGEKVVWLKDLVALLAWVPLDEDSQELAARQGIGLTLFREGKTKTLKQRVLPASLRVGSVFTICLNVNSESFSAGVPHGRPGRSAI